MTEVIVELFQRFAFETGIMGEVRQYGQMGMVILTMLAAVALVLGFKTFRAFFSFLVFIGVTVLSCILLENVADWGEITTCFSVIGTVLALLAYKWHRLGGCIICALIAALTVWTVNESFLIALLLGVLAIISTLLFPVITICLATSLWGSLVLSELLLVTTDIYVIVGVWLAGFAIQMLTNSRQRLFLKKCPDKMTHWLEQRKRKRKKHADSI